MQECTFDIECHINYFLLTIMSYPERKVLGEFEMYNGRRYPEHIPSNILGIMNERINISFNGNKYDMLMLTAYLNGFSNKQLKKSSDEIIKGGMMPWDFERKYRLNILKLNHIDLIEISVGTASLKAYGARVNSMNLQELPVHPNNPIMPHQRGILKGYCINDNIVTCDLRKELTVAIETRAGMQVNSRYGFIDMRSKSDAQVGETTVVQHCIQNNVILRKPNMKTYPKSFRYVSPHFVRFETDKLKTIKLLCESLEYSLSPKHKIINPKELNLIRYYSNEDEGLEIEQSIKITTPITMPEYSTVHIKKEIKMYSGLIKDGCSEIEYDKYNDIIKNCNSILLIRKHLLELKRKQQALTDRQYKIGIGGIHSQLDAGTHYANSEYDLLEIDVSSFYPWIIILSKSHPKQIPYKIWDDVYRGLVQTKIDATNKLIGEKSKSERSKLIKEIHSCKIKINGIYGKLSSHHSKLFAPDVLGYTALTGELSVLMIVEKLHLNNIKVTSVNTDGINVLVKKSMRSYLDKMVKWWCGTTGFEMKYNNYKSIHYRDVNNYFYHHVDGYCSGIGIFASDGLGKNPDSSIIRDSLFAFVKDGIPIEETISLFKVMRQIITLNIVSGGDVNYNYFL
jgi:hypothetical protein